MRKEYAYKEGDLIFVKNRSSLKQDPKWIGPERILRVKENLVLIRRRNIHQWLNIKTIRLFERGQSMGSSIETMISQ